MKTKFTLLVLFVAAAFAANAQQVPNSSFDSWTTDTLAPDGWATYESVFGFPLGLSSKDGVDKIVGPYSIKLKSDSIPGQPAYGVVAGGVGVGKGTMTGQGPQFGGIAFAFKPDTLFLGYKYTSPAADTAIMALSLTKNGGGAFTGGVPTLALRLDTNSQWSLLYTILTSFYTAVVPDTLGMEFYSSAGAAKKGSTLHLDAVLFGYHVLPSALQEVADQLNVSVYPNPASDLITISTDVNTEGFRTMITDMSGKLVYVNILEGQKTIINVSEFANGTYIYRIADAQGNILKQNRFTVAK